jgi:hypothetical protein
VSLGKYLFNILYWLDKGGNTLTGGSPDETISRRAARAKAHGKWWGKAMCWWLSKLDPGHCEHALKRDLGAGAWQGVASDSDDPADLKD